VSIDGRRVNGGDDFKWGAKIGLVRRVREGRKKYAPMEGRMLLDSWGSKKKFISKDEQQSLRKSYLRLKGGAGVV